MIFISFLTGINSMMRGPYGFLLIVVLLFPIMGSTLLQMTVEQDEKSEFDRIQLTYPRLFFRNIWEVCWCREG